MNLHAKLRALEAQGRSICIGLIGAGKFGSMFDSQCLRNPEFQLVAIADLSRANVEAAITVTGHPRDMICGRGIEAAVREQRIGVTEDALFLIRSPFVDIVIEATGDPVAGALHALECFRFGKHVLMVNVEAYALVGPALANEAERAGVIYSLAYGDQPALICEIVDWARASGFQVVAAGKGTKHRPHYHNLTPATVWEHHSLTPEQARIGHLNPKKFNSFLDGTKSALEMAAVANATGLDAPVDGLEFPACSRENWQNGRGRAATMSRPRGPAGWRSSPRCLMMAVRSRAISDKVSSPASALKPVGTLPAHTSPFISSAWSLASRWRTWPCATSRPARRRASMRS